MFARKMRRCLLIKFREVKRITKRNRREGQDGDLTLTFMTLSIDPHGPVEVAVLAMSRHLHPAEEVHPRRADNQ